VKTLGAVSVDTLLAFLKPLRASGKKIVFTNGCFDLIHPGHVTYLSKARELGDILVVGLNTDESVRRQGKGDGRPVMHEDERATVLSALSSVDYVVLFDDDTPLSLIEMVQPDILVKGGDWPIEGIVGREVVEGRGGRVLSISLVEGLSTTDIISRVAKLPEVKGS